MRVWNLQEQSCTAVLKAHLSYVTSLAFLPGNSGLISGGRDRVLNVWDLDRWVKLLYMKIKMKKYYIACDEANMREAFFCFLFFGFCFCFCSALGFLLRFLFVVKLCNILLEFFFPLFFSFCTVRVSCVRFFPILCLARSIMTATLG